MRTGGVVCSACQSMHIFSGAFSEAALPCTNCASYGAAAAKLPLSSMHPQRAQELAKTCPALARRRRVCSTSRASHQAYALLCSPGPQHPPFPSFSRLPCFLSSTPLDWCLAHPCCVSIRPAGPPPQIAAAPNSCWTCNWNEVLRCGARDTQATCANARMRRGMHGKSVR